MDKRDELLLPALEALLVPLARLCVAHGLAHAPVEELLKRAFVRAAREAGHTAGRDVSRVATATGLSRREVTRLSGELAPLPAQRPTPAGRAYAHWMTHPDYRGPGDQPLALPRSGPAPSFDSLAQAITRHVHPRSLLDEMLRLGLVRLSDDGQTVHLDTERVAPTQDDAQMFGFLGANVGDHLAAATANVVHRDRRHFEQAIYADELSEQSAAAIGDLARAQWVRLRAELIPELERLIAADQAAGRPGTHRARLGLFTYHDHDLEPDDATPDTPAP
ncbi:MAG: hypothetical protein EKK52_14325 [Burkholderiales bacterium]|jgi:Family of unknown function (DUF6502)|nr:MAG: hypothetical protein EKK52_14325 [Burkholderiales bacterium]